ncbi:hypothetical protein SODALDRAFT_340253 [Sodiomyces alkalinus F11]|uniref:Uncharacterized protein n=1 Tax=Sodiomyces alkalinus (strain CBS 110278 / VKM F-3762 / F11) TaxID=1314773 RepID=A0A3N2PU03_SODAK|nr:hypothetical protein SODALDRAFT_340253 [Sodiomyces alkalinus F11]ROT37934.1 hypothetical protein SODALDRAFT_340253 [Sodiomyces alkalinus F11]
MYYTSTLTSILEVIFLILPALLAVAFVTVAERKTMAKYVAPTQANTILFFLGYGLIPYGPGLVLNDMELGILYMLAVSALATYGSLRSTAQLISYELVLSSAILLIIMITTQKAVWLLLPIFPVFLIFFIGSAESELVSGFMTEHAAVIFVFFFLAEYGNSGLLSGIVIGLKSSIFVFIFI